MRTFKRNAVIITVILFVSIAAYLNWSYGKTGEPADTAAAESQGIKDTQTAAEQEGEEPEQDAGLYYAPESKEEKPSGYFAATRLNRQQARDSAVETLAMVSGTDGASEEVVSSALAKISAIASTCEKEAELESLIMAKGFKDCVVFISEEGVKVTVPSAMEGLSSTSVAQITEIVTTETEYKAADLKIIPVK